MNSLPPPAGLAPTARTAPGVPLRSRRHHLILDLLVACLTLLAAALTARAAAL